MQLELTEVEIAMLEDGLRTLEEAMSKAAMNGSVHITEETVLVLPNARRFTLLRAKLAGLEVPEALECAGRA